jgi:GntR family transcriptional regulator
MPRQLALPDLDATSPQPPFRQIAAHLRAAIADGRLSAGARLPSEAELVERYGVARMTVRQAIAELRTAGMVEARRGVGVFVRDPAAPSPAAVWRAGTSQRLSAIRQMWPELADVLDRN